MEVSVMRPLVGMLVAAAAVALAACAGQPAKEEQQPHHYSQDKRGNRLACFATDVASEYECLPLARAADYYYDPFYDPFWRSSLNYGYGWPHHPGYVVLRPWPPAPPPPLRRPIRPRD
jgi:hypothetical protein